MTDLVKVRLPSYNLAVYRQPHSASLRHATAAGLKCYAEHVATRINGVWLVLGRSYGEATPEEAAAFDALPTLED